MRPDWMEFLAGTDTPFTGSGDDDAGDFEPPDDPFYEAYKGVFDAELRRRLARDKPAFDAYPEAVRAWREGGEVGPKPRLMWSFDRGAFIDDGEEDA